MTHELFTPNKPQKYKTLAAVEFCDFVGVLTETINILAFESGKDLTCNRNTSREECSLSINVI